MPSNPIAGPAAGPIADPVADLVATARARAAAGDIRGAFDAYRTALASGGDDPELLFETAGILRRLDLHAEALTLLDVLATALPDALPVLHNRASCLADLDRLPEALAAFRTVLDRWSDVAPSWAAFAGTAFGAARPDLGRAAFARAIALAPERTGSYVNFGEALAGEADDEAAVRLLGRAATLTPEDPAIHYNRARSLLATGAFAEGWAAYEARLHPDMNRSVARAVACPRWTGEPLAGRHLFIAGEQGLGDQIWLLPFVREVAGEAGRVTLEVTAKLVELARRSLPGVDVRPLEVEERDGRWYAAGASRTGPADADLFIEMGSLSGLLWHRLAGRAAGPALRPDPERVAHWRGRLDALGPGLKIGLCWRSPLATRGRRQDYLPVDAWQPILSALAASTGPLRLISLQHGGSADDVVRIRQLSGHDVAVLPDLDLWNGLHDTVALMASLDLVVTALTSIALLGGGTGVPTLVVGNSRWVAPMAGRDPVHPSLEPVYPGPGRPWPAGVVTEVAARLAARLA